MKNRLKYPLSIFVVWHPNFLQGKTIANELYSIFCRDIDAPLCRGLGIPVYFRSAAFEKEPILIDTEIAQRNAIILLVDQEYFTDKNFRDYTESLIKLLADNTRIYPIELCEQATALGQGTKSLQFIKAFRGGLSKEDYKKISKKNDFNLADKSDLDLSIKKIKTELLNDCARLLMNFQPTWADNYRDNVPPPVSLFLSHAKKDGAEITKKFKAFIDSELKLDVFFDTVDIADGYEFEQQIETNIIKSALVVFHSDDYSSREWCRIEVLIAKRHKCPIVVVHDIKRGEKRSFPYLGNTPTLKMKLDEKECFVEIVNITLYQVINNLFQRELLESIIKQFDFPGTEFITLTSPPELFNFIDIYNKKKETQNQLIIIYPEPPLGAEELKVLNDIDKDIQFITPILLPTLL